MPIWTHHDIQYVRKRLREKGVVYDALLNELTDHVCREAEERYDPQKTFRQACEDVLRELNVQDLNTIQNETFFADYHKRFMMVRNNFKIMVRNMMKYKTYATLTIGGLAVGLTCFVLIALYVKKELTFDHSLMRFHSLYRVTMSSVVGGKENRLPTSFSAIGPLLKANYPEVENYTRLINYKYSRLVPTFRSGDAIYYESGVLFADTTFFQLFHFPFVEGDAATALHDPNAVVITEEKALKYFGRTNVVGQVLHFNNRADVTITGVVRPLPNTHIAFDFLLPLTAMASGGLNFGPQALNDWQVDWFWTYLLLPNDQTAARLEPALNALSKEHMRDYVSPQLYLQPIREVHLRSSFDYGTDLSANSDLTTLYIFISVGALILLVSSINFVNLTIATSTRRHKEIGVSKVLGAMKSQLRFQFITESVATSLLAFTLAVVLIHFSLPWFGNLLGTSFEGSWFANPVELLSAFAFSLAVGLFSGLYPAYFVSSFDPQRVLKGVWKPGKGGTQFRTVLVGLQVAVSLFLVVGTVVVFQQMNYLQQKDLGYDKSHILMLTVRGTSIPKVYHAFKHKLESHSAVVRVSSVSEPVGREVQFMAFKIDGQTEDQHVKILNVGYDFIETMGLELKEGRDFSRTIPTDSTAGFIINEAAARQYGWDDPLGKSIRHAMWDGAPEGQVIGVVKDFNFEPLHASIDPLILFKGFPAWYVAVRIREGQLQQALSFIEASWKEMEPTKPFNFHFLDESIQRVYDKEKRVRNVFLVFALLSVVTVAFGLYGLVSFVAEQRLPEIGVRKVLGASSFSIIRLFTKEYLGMLLIAGALALPVSWLILNQWLENFAFHINIQLSYFLLGTAGVFVIVLGTIAGRAWAASSANPVEVLKADG